MQAKEYFEKAADNVEAGGFYNLGVMYLKGIGVKRDVKIASEYFITAFDAGQPKAFYQLAKMFHTGVGLKKNVPLVSQTQSVIYLCIFWDYRPSISILYFLFLNLVTLFECLIFYIIMNELGC